MEPPPSTEIRATNAATGWVIALSAGLIGLGILAILMPAIASAVFTSVIGWIALVSGVFQVGQAFQAKAFRGQGLGLGVGILYAIAGLYILLNLVNATALLTLAFGLLLMAEGVFTIAMAFTYRAGGTMSWFVAINGIITLILGILAFNRWPFSALWLIGLYVGISLLLTGSSLLGAALALRKQGV
ncbi:HdeD family acid-resistance protein [Nodosilinea sp. AN01ver1]